MPTPAQIAGCARRLLGGPVGVSLLAIAVRALMLFVLCQLPGARGLERPFTHLHAVWIAVVAISELLTYPAYVLAYRQLGRLSGSRRLSTATLTRMVIAGFGPLAALGGFGIDGDVLRALEGDETSRSRVAAMATLEWTVLAAVTGVVAIGLLVMGPRVAGSLLWPWAVGVPLGVVAAAWATDPRRIERLSRPLGRRVAVIARGLAGVDSVRTMVRRPRRYLGAWGATAAYWTVEIAALFAALRAVGLDLGVARTILAYATGYLVSRRSLPLGGAGLAEALLVYALTELGQPLGPALAAVMVYRVFNFLLATIPALIAYHGLAPALAQARARGADDRR